MLELMKAQIRAEGMVHCSAYRFMLFHFIDGWNREGHPYKKLEYGKWELQIPANPDGSCPITHISEIKVIIKNE
jgi:hypothetical protein